MAMSSASASKPLPTPPADTPVNIKAQSPSPKRNNDVSSTSAPVRTREAPANATEDDEEFEFFQSFQREKVKDVIHTITAELKDRGADVEYLMIPFRPQQTNEKLLRLLNALFPMGNGEPVAEKQRLKIIQKTEPLTLFQGLTYLWCRLPDGEVIGWKAYLQFKAREKEKNYPARGFLELMPQCLSSPSHASIVYDFFDIIISLASNSRVNKMSARKISKMCAIWAFGKPLEEAGDSLDYDFTNTSESPNNSFQDGLDDWIPATDATFHLLLAFLKSFVPQDLESAQLPLTLKSLLFNNEYPPKGSTAYSSQTVLTIPLVTLKTDRFSRKPWELLERCGSSLDFSKYDAFQAREDYALLKSLFKKSNQVEGISRKMSQESRRLMKLMSTKHSTFQAGWSKRKCLPNESKLPESVEVDRVDIDDYFIWAWLSTLSYEQTSSKRNLFGRSLILEFEFDGFKKWVLFQECDITLEARKHQRQRDTDVPLPVNSETPKKQLPPTEQRKITPVYENFQKRVPSGGSNSSVNEVTSNEVYHTVISKDPRGKNGSKHNVNLHAIEQKISKWNPLSKVKRKTSGNDSVSSKEEKDVAESKEKKNSILIDHHRSIYELPPIERDVDGFKDIFAGHGLDDDDDIELEPGYVYMTPEEPASVTTTMRAKNSSDEAMEELKGMMDQMITEDKTNPVDDTISSTTGDSTRETFESLTKFDQYKPTEVYTNTPTSSGSGIPSLKLNGSVPSLQPSEPQDIVASQGILLERQLPEIRINNGSQASSPTRQGPDVALQDKVLPARPVQYQPGGMRSPPPEQAVEYGTRIGSPEAEVYPQRSRSPPRPQTDGPVVRQQAEVYPPRSTSPRQAEAYAQRSRSPPRPQTNGPVVRQQAEVYPQRSRSPPRPQAFDAAPPRQAEVYPQRSRSPPRPQTNGPVVRQQAEVYHPRSASPPRPQADGPFVRPQPGGYVATPRSPPVGAAAPPRIEVYPTGSTPPQAAGLAPQAEGYATRSRSPPRRPAFDPAAPWQENGHPARSRSPPRAAGFAPRSRSPPRPRTVEPIEPPQQFEPAAYAPPMPYPQPEVYAQAPPVPQAFDPRVYPPAEAYAARSPPAPQMAYPPADAYGSPRLAGAHHNYPAARGPPSHYPAAGYPGHHAPNGGYPRWGGAPAPPRAHPRPRAHAHGHVDPSAKLHGGHTNRQQERKKLHNNIRNGDFGI